MNKTVQLSKSSGYLKIVNSSYFFTIRMKFYLNAFKIIIDLNGED